MARRRTTWGCLGLLLLAAGAIGFAVLWSRSQARPTWWKPPDPGDPHIREVAERVEYQLIEQAQLVRPQEDEWGVRVQESQINAWLASRLPKWLAHHDLEEWTDAVQLVQVRCEDGAVIVGAEVSGRLQPRVVSVRLVPELKDGRVAVVADSVSIGRLTIGTSSLDAALEELRGVISSDVLNDPDVVRAIETLRGERTWPAEVKLADGRLVDVLELTIEQGAISVKCRTKN